MEEIIYKTKGVCSKEIHIKMEGSTIIEADFTDGCDGNLSGIAKLIKGMEVSDVIERLQGIRCGNKATSCPDQIAQALKENIGK